MEYAVRMSTLMENHAVKDEGGMNALMGTKAAVSASLCMELRFLQQGAESLENDPEKFRILALLRTWEIAASWQADEKKGLPEALLGAFALLEKFGPGKADSDRIAKFEASPLGAETRLFHEHVRDSYRGEAPNQYGSNILLALENEPGVRTMMARSAVATVEKQSHAFRGVRPSVIDGLKKNTALVIAQFGVSAPEVLELPGQFGVNVVGPARSPQMAR